VQTFNRLEDRAPAPVRGLVLVQRPQAGGVERRQERDDLRRVEVVDRRQRARAVARRDVARRGLRLQARARPQLGLWRRKSSSSRS
jgi:hypothetical protein